MEWFERWFQKEYDDIYVNRNDEQAIAQVNALLSRLDIGTESMVLDIGCGKGRHLRELLSKGLHAVGVDLSFYLLCQAAEAGTRNLMRSDMRYLPFKLESFDLVCSFFTSFGYFKTREENLSLIEIFASRVKPGGYLFMDLMNREVVLKSLPKKDTKRINEAIVTQDRYLEGNCVCKDIFIEYGEHRVEKYSERVMIFEHEELFEEFKKYNLDVVDIMGDEYGNAYTAESPRYSIILKKGL